MNIKKINTENAHAGLDGSAVDVTSSMLRAPDKNDYFLGFIGIALGIASILYALLHYADTDTGLKLTTEAWIFLVLGAIFFVVGLVLVIIAAVYLYTLKPFLNSAKFTKCNVKCLAEHKKVGSKNDWHYQSYYTIRIDYINDNGKKCTKVIKWILAYKYYKNLLRDFEIDPPLYTLNYACIVAYDDKGKVVLLYK